MGEGIKKGGVGELKSYGKNRKDGFLLPYRHLKNR